MKFIAITILSVFLSATSFSQRIQHFIDSVEQVIKNNNYNRVDTNKKKQGYWIEMGRHQISDHNLSVLLYSGFFNNDKQVGVWELNNYGLWLMQRDIFLDSAESLKIESTFFPNGSMATEDCYYLNKKVYDTIFDLDLKTEQLVKRIKLGKYVKNGVSKTYWENGAPRSIGRFENDKKIGVWLYYNEKGELVKRE